MRVLLNNLTSKAMEELYKQRLRELYDAVNTGNGLEQAMIEARVLLGVTDCDLKRPKPNWDDAPDWAEWWAVNENGMSYYTMLEPTPTRNGYWANCGCWKFAGEVELDCSWFDTLTKRP